MAEYIERGALIKRLTTAETIGARALYIIQKEPAADVRPERHGEWLGTVCTACGMSVSFYFDCNYCPICGAKMDGEDGKHN